MSSINPQHAEVCLSIKDESDVAMARKHARELAARQGFSDADSGALATAISEIVRNVVMHAFDGSIQLRAIENSGRSGVVVVVCDHGPGIADLSLAEQDGYSTLKNSLGLGLSSARRLVDAFQITSELGRGTTVTLTKWASASGRLICRVNESW